MIRSTMLVAAVGLLVAVIGCTSDTTPTEKANNPEGNAETSTEVEQNLAELSPTDRELAEAQKICPVTEEPLGSMGVPIKVEVEGTAVFICCAHCEEKLKADPEKYLAKIED